LVSTNAGRLVGVFGCTDLLTVFLRSDDEIRDEVADEVRGRMLLVDPRRSNLLVHWRRCSVPGGPRS